MELENPVPQGDPSKPVISSPIPQKTNLFVGEHGLRCGWRLLIYLLMVIAAAAAISIMVRHFWRPPRGVPSPGVSALQEAISFALVFGAAWVMSRIEHRSVGEYGLPLSDAFGWKFWLGFLFGLVEISVLIGLIAAFGGYWFGPLALHGSEILKWGLIHMVLFIFVGFFEEFLFRGYVQYTLADGIGFWPAGIILSVVFGALHLGNPGEGWVGAASVVLIGLFFVFTLRRTGSLWYAVGLHASFDWGETFLYSVPNSGTVMEGHLSHAALPLAPKWLTGGTVGPEGSVFCFLTMGLQFLVVMWLFPKKDPGRQVDTASPAQRAA
jgi:membrane protease YdiL (CAAX protease family)